MSEGKLIRRGRKVPAKEIREPVQKPRMLIIADFPVKTGFGTVTHNLVKYWRDYYDLHIMGINYYGDWTPEVAEYKIWPAANDKDVYGISKSYSFLRQLQPDIVFVLNDPWVAVDYVKPFSKYREEFPHTKFFLYAPIDAPNVKKQFVEPLNKVFDGVIAYTEFAREEFIFAGLTTDLHVLPHGVDTTTYKPMSKREAKKLLGIPEDTFVVLTNSRNQPRKRLDLSMQYFAEWVKRYDLPGNVRWYYHGAIHDVGWDILQLAEYFGIKNRLILSDINMASDHTLPVEHMNVMNNSADIFFSTTVAEG